MKPDGWVIWLLAGATWAVLGGLGCLLRRFRGAPDSEPEVPCITGVPATPAPPGPDDYVSEQPAFDSAYAMEADATYGDEQ
jgi:hypothetical protein